MKPISYSSLSAVLMLICLSAFSTAEYVWKCPEDTTGGEYKGDAVQINYEVLTNTSFSVSWSTPRGGVGLVNLEYKCSSAEKHEKVSDVFLPLSDYLNGNREIQVADLEGPVECVVYGCYMDDYWYEIFYTDIHEFKLQPLPMPPAEVPSPSSTVSVLDMTAETQNSCECSTSNAVRVARDIAADSTEGSSNTLPYIILSTILGTFVCLLIVLNIILLIRIKLSRGAATKFNSKCAAAAADSNDGAGVLQL